MHLSILNPKVSNVQQNKNEPCHSNLLDRTIYSSYLSMGNFVVSIDTLSHREPEDNPGEM